MSDTPTGRWAKNELPIQSWPIRRREPEPQRTFTLQFDYAAAELSFARADAYQAELEQIRKLVQEIGQHAQRYAKAKRIIKRAVRGMSSTSRHYLMRNTNIFTLS